MSTPATTTATTLATTPATPRARILPTEPGDWRVRVAGGRPCIVAVVAAHYPVPELRRPLRDTEEGTLIVPEHDGDEVTWCGFEWLARIPTPEQLAAQAAQLAAGQALADHLRHCAELRGHNPATSDAGPDTSERAAFLAAFPPAGGAR